MLVNNMCFCIAFIRICMFPFYVIFNAFIIVLYFVLYLIILEASAL